MSAASKGIRPILNYGVSVKPCVKWVANIRGSYEERESARNRMSRLRDRATQLEIQINADLF